MSTTNPRRELRRKKRLQRRGVAEASPVSEPDSSAQHVAAPLGRLTGVSAAAPPVRVTASGPLVYRGVNSDMAFREITALSDLGRLSEPHRLCLAPPLALPQLPLFNEGGLPENVVAEHHASELPPPVFIYGLPNHELGGLGLLHSEGRFFVTPDAMPSYYTHYLRADDHILDKQWGGAILDPDAKILEVDVPLAVPLHPNLVYGHFLLEMFPKLHLLSRLRRAGAPFAIAIPDEIAVWAKRIVALYFDDTEILYYDARTCRVRSPCFIVPSMMHTGHQLHPDFNLAIDEIKDFVLPRVPMSGSHRVWLSRKNKPGWRGILNEDEVEDTVASLGFTIVHPQEHSFPDQIAIMDGADCIAAEYSSAIHGTLFARRQTKVFCINRSNAFQSGIGALRSQPLAYLPPADGKFRDARYRNTAERHYEVNCAELREQLARFAES